MAFYLSMGLCAMGLAAAALTIAWPLKLQPDPFAEPFGDVPHLGDRL
ncbi:hypothetical protein [Tardiphaga sp. vice304]|nr:hypothetical protein [Tardiphaga sp. vice304]